MHLLERLPQAEIHGADLDAEAIDWAARELAPGRFAVCGPQPPLPYADEGFDLVIATSVFTHLEAALQEVWLREVRRILRPGGLLLATTMGRFFAGFLFAPARVDAMFADGIDDGMVTDMLDGIAPANYYRAVYQTLDYTERTWGRTLEVVDRIEAGNLNRQDVFLLRKR
jgi:SAM-dependent methyltransferase